MSYQFTDINGVRMHYDVQGEGEALVLVHAGIANLNMWDEQVAAFKEHNQVIRHDVRGWGETPDPAGEYSDHGDLDALMEHLGVERAAVLGISNGGRIAIDFAIAYPHRVSKLIVVAPGLGGFDYPEDKFDESMSEQVQEAEKARDLELAAELETQLWVDGPYRKPDEVDAAFRKRAKQLIRHTLELPEGEGVGQIERPPAAGRLSEIQAPTLIIIGDKDVDSLMAVANALASQVPQARKVVMEGTAHLPPMERADEFNRLVLDFLQE